MRSRIRARTTRKARRCQTYPSRRSSCMAIPRSCNRAWRPILMASIPLCIRPTCSRFRMARGGRSIRNTRRWKRSSRALLTGGLAMKSLLAIVLLAGGTLPIHAADCAKILGPQTADAASLQRVEDAWNEAFNRGNTDYLECLLVPDFVTVTPHGKRDRAWELEHARQNR